MKKLLLVALLALGLTACISTKSYVDPSYAKTDYSDLKRHAEPAKWQIAVEFQRNGTPYPKANATLKDQVERVVRASGLAVPTTDTSAPVLKVVLNNVADLGDAAGKGFGTGLTFGLAGNTVTDGYVMDAVLTVNGKEIKALGIKHAIHTTIGNTTGPAGMEPTTPIAAFNKVVEQLVLNALKEIDQKESAITQAPAFFERIVALVMN